MSIEFLEISRSLITDEGEPDISSLALYSEEPDRVRVIGVLPHHSSIRPETAKDRDRLVGWLNGLEYGKGA